MVLFEKSVSPFTHKVLFFPLSLLIFLSPFHLRVDNENQKFSSQIFKVDFSKFSPAFAVLEDEFLFEQISMNKLPIKKDSPQKTVANPVFLNGFDGEVNMKNISHLTKSTYYRKKSQKKRTVSDAGELKFGPLVSIMRKTHETIGTDSDPERTREDYKIRGDIFLKEGLAFMGSMEVQWVLSDHVLNSGSINTKKATYEIKVNQLIGNIVVSIYDNNNKLIGEGSVSINRLSKASLQISKNIEVFPLNWDYAGQTIDGGFLDSKNKALFGVNISLYGFNEQTKTDRQGLFSFHNWKKVNSRSIAMASRPGYYDSLFIIDSRQPVSIPLFSESYMQAFFSYLEDQGLDDIRERGTVYGIIEGVEDKSGYRVFIENKKPIYFTAGFADTKAIATSSNGLFSFVGLEDGDYKLIIEKEGQILDQKWIVVESSKVSSFFYNPQKIQQYLAHKTVDPIEKSNPGFFDNDSDLSQNFTFPSRKSFSEIPFISDERLQKLAKKQNMKIDEGLIFGFIKSPEKYQVALLEESPKKVIYFNEKAEMIDPSKEIASGFIIGGFSKGLSSLAIQTNEMVLATDLVFNDHKAISVVSTEVFPVESL